MNLAHIRTALVDFDGTLLDSTGCWVETYRLLCETKKINSSQTVIDSFNQIDFSKWQELIFMQIGECHDILIECAKATYEKRLPKQSVLEIINLLPNDCAVAVVSKEPNALIEHWLGFHKLKRFSSIDTVSEERDNPEYYKMRDLLLIDDNYKHCLAAKLANAMVVGVNDNHTEERKTQMREICDIYLDK